MERPLEPSRASQMAQRVVRRFGAAGAGIRVHMRDCDDVRRYIQNMESAHRQTAQSTLRFGPPASQSR